MDLMDEISRECWKHIIKYVYKKWIKVVLNFQGKLRETIKVSGIYEFEHKTISHSLFLYIIYT